MSGRNLDFQSSCCSVIIIRHLQGPLVSRCPQPRICREREQRQNTWPYWGQIRETKCHPTKGTRQIPSGYGRAPATVPVRCRQGGRGQGAGGRQTHGRGREQYEKEEIAGQNHILGPPRKAGDDDDNTPICFWQCFGGRNEKGDRTMKIWGVFSLLFSVVLFLLYQHASLPSSTSLM